MESGNAEIPHRVEQTRNKHSRAVYKNDTIVIRLAKNLSKSQQQEHIDSLLSRMTKQVVKDIHNRKDIDPFRPLLEGQNSMCLELPNGLSHTIHLQAGTRKRVQIIDDQWMITVSPKMREKQLHQLLWNTLRDQYLDTVTDLVMYINEQTLQKKITSVSMKYATSQWGSCSTKNTIMLNTALLLVDQSLLEYVIVHELAHLVHHDHSPAYWRVVEKYMSDYPSRRKQLKSYRLLAL